MNKLYVKLARFALPSLLACGAIAASPPDLSKYREFQLGTDLATVVKQTGITQSDPKTVFRRPALIQELSWRPRPIGGPPTSESVQEVTFSFYNGELFQIAVNYDRYETEGLTWHDVADLISANYGPPTEPTGSGHMTLPPYGDQEEIVAQWQDPQYRFDLIRSSYGPSFKLVGTFKKLDSQAKAAMLEAARIDKEEAPQRETERLAKESQNAQAKLDTARVANKAKFKP